MSMEEIIRSWKTDGETLDLHLPASPVGQELSEEELLEVSGGCAHSCGGGNTCAITCFATCDNTGPNPQPITTAG